MDEDRDVNDREPTTLDPLMSNANLKGDAAILQPDSISADNVSKNYS